MIRATRKKKFSRLRRLLSCTVHKDSKRKGADNYGETDSSCENQNKDRNQAAEGIPSTPAKASRLSSPSTPSTIPETPTPEKNGRTKDTAFGITYNDDYSSTPDAVDEKETEALTRVAFVRTDSTDTDTDGFEQHPNVPENSNNPRRKQDISTAYEIDQRQLVISTEDDIVSLQQQVSIDLEDVNRQLFQKLEESQKDVLASIVDPERIDPSIHVKKQKAFAKIPDHPALGNLEKYRSGLALGNSRQINATVAKGGIYNSFIAESDSSVGKGSVSEGLKLLWDETTKNLESMNKVFSSCALDWKHEAQESFGEFAYNGESGKRIPLSGEWLAVPDTHGEDISLLSNPKDIASISSSRWTESPLDGIPVLKKETATIVEGDEPIQENSKSRYNRWL